MCGAASLSFVIKALMASGHAPDRGGPIEKIVECAFVDRSPAPDGRARRTRLTELLTHVHDSAERDHCLREGIARSR